MIKAIEEFNKLRRGVLGIVKAADVYALHLIASIRKEEPDIEGINSIITKGKVSVLNITSQMYSKSELEILENEGHFTEIGQQIIVATHTALESYLNLKFQEYYRFLSFDSKESLVEETLNRIRFRSLKDISKAYFKFFGIHIPSIDINYYGANDCNFKPINSWEALRLISDTRNDIVHKGCSSDYKITTLMDSWYPFEFVMRWVDQFNLNFDYFIYEGKETKYYSNHKEKSIKAGVLNKK